MCDFVLFIHGGWKHHILIIIHPHGDQYWNPRPSHFSNLQKWWPYGCPICQDIDLDIRCAAVDALRRVSRVVYDLFAVVQLFFVGCEGHNKHFGGLHECRWIQAKMSRCI